MPTDSVATGAVIALTDVRSEPGLPHIAGLAMERKISQGGMGAIYTAHELATGERVAVKVLRSDLPADCRREYRLRFERECRLHLQLPSHPNIVECGRSGITREGLPYLVMEHVAGGDLAEFVMRNGPLGVLHSIQIARNVLDALRHLYSNDRIVHRDIKAENILLSPVGWTSGDTEPGFVPKLADLGLAKGARTREITVRGFAPPLSVRAVAPEILRPQVRTDHRADIYGVGCVLYFALVGCSPFEEPNSDAVVFRKLYFEADPITDFAPTLPADLVAIVTRSLRRSPEHRFANYEEFDAALGTIAQQIRDEDARVAAANRWQPAAAWAESALGNHHPAAVAV